MKNQIQVAYPFFSKSEINYIKSNVPKVLKGKLSTGPFTKEFENTLSIESHDIHQKIYEIATKSKNTTLDLDSPGGSENFQSDPGKWNSGNGWGKF